MLFYQTLFNEIILSKIKIGLNVEIVLIRTTFNVLIRYIIRNYQVTLLSLLKALWIFHLEPRVQDP